MMTTSEADFIGGRWSPSIGRAPLEVIDPTTGNTIGTVVSGTPVDVEHAVREPIEIAYPEAGVVAFQWSVDTWRDVIQTPGIEPSPGLADARKHHNREAPQKGDGDVGH